MPPFALLLRQAQISILEILNVFVRLKLSPSLYLAKIGRSSKVSMYAVQVIPQMDVEIAQKGHFRMEINY